jgi:hypothetical protein
MRRTLMYCAKFRVPEKPGLKKIIIKRVSLLNLLYINLNALGLKAYYPDALGLFSIVHE